MKQCQQEKEPNTNADLSDKTELATSPAFHVLLSFDVRKVEFGGPICKRQHQSKHKICPKGLFV